MTTPPTKPETAMKTETIEFLEVVEADGYRTDDERAAARCLLRMLSTGPRADTCLHDWQDLYRGTKRTHLICSRCSVKRRAP